MGHTTDSKSFVNGVYWRPPSAFDLTIKSPNARLADCATIFAFMGGSEGGLLTQVVS